ncbi:hypothetical protein TNCV_4275331 [Trichonephila clavipes]|nr:hypothetical protein TNCV_4275331 [Trichonephila clavipes]
MRLEEVKIDTEERKSRRFEKNENSLKEKRASNIARAKETVTKARGSRSHSVVSSERVKEEKTDPTLRIICV